MLDDISRKSLQLLRLLRGSRYTGGRSICRWSTDQGNSERQQTTRVACRTSVSPSNGRGVVGTVVKRCSNNSHGSSSSSSGHSYVTLQRPTVDCCRIDHRTVLCHALAADSSAHPCRRGDPPFIGKSLYDPRGLYALCHSTNCSLTF